MPANIYIRDEDVIPRLTAMGFNKASFREILMRVAGERANVTANDPPSARNYEGWRWGTRFCRECEEFKETGYERCEHDQISGIRNDNLRLKLVVCNTNKNTGHPEIAPKNITIKGPNSCDLIGLNSPQTDFSFIRRAFNRGISDYALWYLCAYFGKNDIRAEVSRPESEVGGIITSWSDRIIIAGPGELPLGGISKDVPEEFAEVPTPIVKRKK